MGAMPSIEHVDSFFCWSFLGGTVHLSEEIFRTFIFDIFLSAFFLGKLGCIIIFLAATHSSILLHIGDVVAKNNNIIPQDSHFIKFCTEL